MNPTTAIWMLIPAATVAAVLCAPVRPADEAQCRYGVWSEPVALTAFTNGTRHYADFAVDSATRYIAMVRSTWVPGARTVDRVVSLTAQGTDEVQHRRTLETPSGPFRFHWPRVAIDRAGTLNIVWAEGDSVTESGAVAGDRFTSLWRAVLDERGWGQPSRIDERRRIDWRPPGASQIVEAPDGSLHLAYPGADADRYTVIHAIISGTGSEAHEVRIPTIALYADIAVGLHGRAVLVYAGVPDVPNTVGNRLFVLRGHRTGSGWTWSDADVIPVPHEVHRPRIVMSPSDSLFHLVWHTDTPRDEGGGGKLWHAFSTDGGVKWSEATTVATRGEPYAPSLAVDPCGTIHVAFVEIDHSSTPARPELRYVRVEREGWTALETVPGAMAGSDPVLRYNPAAAIELLWTAASHTGDRPTEETVIGAVVHSVLKIDMTH